MMAARLCLLLAAFSQAQAFGEDESRVAPDGPYRSKMRIVEQAAPSVPRDTEAALDALAQDPYGAAMLLRSLAYAAVADGDDKTAARRLREALAKNGLAPLAQAQIRADLVRLWARNNDDEALAIAYLDWRAAGFDFDASGHLAAARANARLARYALAIEALDRALALNTAAPRSWHELKIFVLSRLGRYAEAAATKSRFLDIASADRDQWLQLAGLYQAAQLESETLAVMELGYRAAKLTRPSDIANLALLYRRAGLPDYAARLLADNLTRGVLSDNAGNWLNLAEAFLAAGDDRAALEPLVRATQLNSDPLMQLQLGRLHFRLQQFARAIDRLKAAVRADLGAEQGRALLLLGEAYIENGNIFRARAAFKKASDIGGSYRDAQAWLDRLAQRSLDEPQPAEPTRADASAKATTPQSAPGQALVLLTKTVHRQRFYYTADTVSLDELADKSVAMARRLRNSVRRERLSASGPLQFIVLADPDGQARDFELQVGIPVRSRVPPRGEFRNRDIKPFLCVHREFLGNAAALGKAWAELHADVVRAGHELTGETRTVVLNFAGPGEALLFELQVGIRPSGPDRT